MELKKVAGRVVGIAQKARLHHIGEQRVGAVLAAYPKDSSLVCLCRACGLEQREPIGEVLQVKPYGGLTREELAQQLRCARASCEAEVEVSIELPKR